MRNRNEAVELMFDAFDAVEDTTRSVSYYDRQSGEVDAQACEIVGALLTAGWRAPEDARAAKRQVLHELAVRMRTAGDDAGERIVLHALEATYLEQREGQA